MNSPRPSTNATGSSASRRNARDRHWPPGSRICRPRSANSRPATAPTADHHRESLESEPTSVGRHYGDIGALFALDDVGVELAAGDGRRRIDASVRAIARDSFAVGPPPVPAGGYAASAAFQPGAEVRVVLEACCNQ